MVEDYVTTKWIKMSIRNPRTSLMYQSRPNDGVEDDHQDRRTNRSSRQSYGGAIDEMLLISKTSRTSSSTPFRRDKTFQWRS
jgi:L,D-peptidoglycan transpeptidase YkuD (ErfK/YbiS/YcfS/YnhG family)